MDASVFEEKLREETAYAEQVLKEHLPKEEGLQGKIMEAMNYSLLAGGKRLRPILMRGTYRMCGGEEKGAIERFMAAIEMIHTYSLVHDDLPAMDNDRYRRGRETTWYAYGETMGILAGDGLLNYAFETAIGALGESGAEETGRPAADAKRLVEMERTAAALSVLARKAGIYGMIGGQTVDVLAEKEPEQNRKDPGQTADRIVFIHAHKTAALIQAAMMVGAILAGASGEQVEEIERCAYQIGLAFQIQDDILDVVGDSRELGKSTGSDATNRKETYVTWKGLDQAKADVEALSREAAAILDGFGDGNAFLKHLILTLIHRRK